MGEEEQELFRIYIWIPWVITILKEWVLLCFYVVLWLTFHRSMEFEASGIFIQTDFLDNTDHLFSPSNPFNSKKKKSQMFYVKAFHFIETETVA